ncbi:MAG: hypothetical protein FE78DRAFT_361236 [Acidomyces sp. 'richmondensis']|nr:MAG: hypothetical protein FE78DRAFT_361236 [Acidomyces sp. 'richmondensis']
MAISVVMAAAVLLVGPPSGGGMDPPPYVSCIGTNILTRALDSNETHVVEYHKDAIKGGRCNPDSQMCKVCVDGRVKQFPCPKAMNVGRYTKPNGLSLTSHRVATYSAPEYTSFFSLNLAMWQGSDSFYANNFARK